MKKVMFMLLLMLSLSYSNSIVWAYETNSKGTDTSLVSTPWENFTLTGSYVKSGATVYIRDKNFRINLAEKYINIYYYENRNGIGYYKEKYLDISAIEDNVINFVITVDSNNLLDVRINTFKLSIGTLFDGDGKGSSPNRVFIQNWTDGALLTLSLYNYVFTDEQITAYFAE